MSATLLLLAAILRPQEPDAKLLTPGVVLHGEVTAASPEITDPELEMVRDRTFLPLRACAFRVATEKGGSFAIALEAPLFHTFVVLRDDTGRIVAKEFCDGTSWPRADLVAGRSYRLDCCSTLGAVGTFTVQLLPASPDAVPDRIARLRQRLAERQQALGGDDLQVATVLDSLGFILYSQSDFTAALECMQKALPIWQRRCGETSLMAAYGHFQVAAQLRGRGRNDDARPHLQACVALREAALGPDHFRVMVARNMLGVVEQERGDLVAAEACFQGVLAVATTGDPRQVGARLSARQNLAYVMKEQGKFTAAKALAEEVLAEREGRFGADDVGNSWILGTLGGCEAGLGRYAQAEVLFRRALAIRQKGLPPDHADIGTALNNLAVILLDRGKAGEAEPHFAECLRVYRRRLGDHVYTAVAQGNLGDCLVQQGRLDDGEQQLRQTLALLDQLGLGRHLTTAKIFRALAAADFHRRNWPAAAAGFQRAVDLLVAAQGPLHPETLGARMQHAYLLRLSGRLDEALAEYVPVQRDLLAVFGPDHPRVNAMTEGTAILFATTGREQDAFASAVQAVAGRWRHLGGELVASSSEDRFRDAAALQRSVDILLTVAGRTAGPAELDAAFEWQAAARGIVHRHALRQRERSGTRMTEAQRALQTDLEVCRAQLARLAYDAAPPDLQEHVRRITALHDRKNEIEGRLGASLGMRVQDERLAVAEFARQMPADSVLLDLSFHVPYRFAEMADGRMVTEEGGLPERCLVWVVAAGGEHALRIDLGPAAPIGRAVEEFVQDLAGRRGRPVRRADEKSPNDVLRALLWEPLVPHVGQRRLVFVAADRELAKVPLAALQQADGRFLIETRTFVCVQDPISLDRDLRRGPVARCAAPGLLAVGAVQYDAEIPTGADSGLALAEASALRGGFTQHWGSLAHTRGEVEAIEALHRRHHAAARRQALTDAAATKARLVAESSDFQVLHLATHGFFEPAGLPSVWEQALATTGAMSSDGSGPARFAMTGHPPGLLAGLVLAGANQETNRSAGVLTAEEVGGLDLARCELVVLSACETALGLMRGGEGMLSLRRAFHEAGARTVVSSLWSVVDETTAQLMRDFYVHLWRGGLPPAEALRRAQLDMLGLQRRRGPAHVQPSAWGAFVLSGEWR